MDGIDNVGCTDCTRFLPCDKHRGPRINIVLLPNQRHLPPSSPATFTMSKGPTPAILYCPRCGAQHIEKGKWAKFDHPEHLCYACGSKFPDPAGKSVGVAALPEDLFVKHLQSKGRHPIQGCAICAAELRRCYASLNERVKEPTNG